MFGKILNRLLSPSKKDLRPNADEIYTELLGMLREVLLPLGFEAVEKAVNYGKYAHYRRGTLLVELYIEFDVGTSVDERYGFIQFFASRDMQDLAAPPRQVSMSFSSDGYTVEQKIALRSKLEDWLKTSDQK